MQLEELLWLVNENTIVQIYSAESNDLLAEYDGKESIPEKYNECNITDIFPHSEIEVMDNGNEVYTTNILCIEIETEVA